MTAEAAGMLACLRAAGFSVRVAQGRLLVAPASALPPQARAILAAHRDELVTALQVVPPAIRSAIERIAAVRRWQAAEVVDAFETAARCPDAAGWRALAELVEATAGATDAGNRRSVLVSAADPPMRCAGFAPAEVQPPEDAP